MTKDDPDAVRTSQVRQLFRASSYARTRNGVLQFYGWLEQNCPKLVPSTKYGDPYQSLKSDLSGLWAD